MEGKKGENKLQMWEEEKERVLMRTRNCREDRGEMVEKTEEAGVGKIPVFEKRHLVWL
jgi:hypothetical protein